MTTIEPTQDSEEWQRGDDYGPAWRNPLFQPATSTDRGRPATETRQERENVHAPALTVPGFTAALTALGRDGGERVCVECDEPVDSQGTTTGECPGGSGDKCDECFACSCDGSC